METILLPYIEILAYITEGNNMHFPKTHAAEQRYPRWISVSYNKLLRIVSNF